MLIRARASSIFALPLLLWIGCVGEDSASAPSAVDAGTDGGSSSGTPVSSDAGQEACSGTMCSGACSAGTCGDEIVEVTAGRGFQCALRRDGKVVCWGSNASYSLGVEPAAGDPTCSGEKCLGPTLVPGVANAVHISAGGENVCAIGADGSLVCWGQNTHGVLAVAPGTIAHSSAPMAIPFPAGTKIAQVSVGYSSACARTTAGDVYCWGANKTCVTGKTTSGSDTLSPNKIALGASDATFVSLSATDEIAVHACAVRNNDTLWCWGSNYNFELGQSNTSGTACSDNGFDVPKQVPGLTGIIEVGTGNGSTCSVASNGAVKCWGATVYGATAQTTPAAPTPTTVAGLPAGAIKHVEMANAWTSVQDASGNTWSWGSASSGEMGDGSSDGASCPNLVACRFVVSSIANLAGVKQLAAGQWAGVALRADGAVVAWGGNGAEALGHAPGTMGDTTCGGSACNPTPVVVKMP